MKDLTIFNDITLQLSLKTGELFTVFEIMCCLLLDSFMSELLVLTRKTSMCSAANTGGVHESVQITLIRIYV